MKYRLLIILALMLVTVLSATDGSRNEVVVWSEDFEGSILDWTHYCEPANMWHSVAQYEPPEGWISSQWVMGNGYADGQYLVLDTPARTITDSTAILSFNFDCNIQVTYGADAPYNGLDAFNVRISTDGGNVWIPISGSPAYNMSSSQAFGEQFGEGPGIPGWGGYMGWQSASFNLAAYIGQSVKIRFAFASDASISSDYYYVILDNIAFGGYTNDGNDDGQMISRNLGPASEDLWHLATDISAPSPTHIMLCQNAEGSYNPFMRNYLVSPIITLPPDGSLRADFMLKGGFSDDEYGDCFGWEICGTDGIWQPLSVDYYSPVFYDPPDAWLSMVEYYGPDQINGNLDMFSGQTVRFRWYLLTDGDVPAGIGLMLDDLKIWHDLVLSPPQNLLAVVEGTSVDLSWIPPQDWGPTHPITSYSIFRDGTELTTIDGTASSYTDTAVPVGFHSYYLMARSDVYLSELSNTAQAYVTGTTQTEIAHDDGSAEAGFSVGTRLQMAVKFTSGIPVSLRYAKVFVQEPGTQGIILCVFDDDGPNGIPGTQLALYYAVPISVNVGWNYLPLPDGITLSDGSFYLVLVETPSENIIGLDTSASGHSYQNANGVFSPVSSGELMIRAIVEPSTANDDNTIPPLKLEAGNHPNPFNPNTILDYSIPAPGYTSLKIYDLKGRLVRTLVDEFRTAGRYSVLWDGRDSLGREVSSALYFYHLTCGGRSFSGKMILAK